MTTEAVVLATPGGLTRCAIFLRSRRGWKQAQVAEAVDRSQQWVSKFELGRCEVAVGDALAVLTSLGARISIRPIEAPREDATGYG